MDAASSRLAEKEDREGSIGQQAIVHRVVLFLAALTRRLFSSVLGVDDAPFGAVMGTRRDACPAAGAEDVGATGGGSSSSGATTIAASVSETPSRCARAVRERAGVSPRVRSAAWRAGKRTWIH